MTKWLCWLALAGTFCLVAGNVSMAGHGCGCDRSYGKSCCRHHCCRCECEEREPRESRVPRAALAPRAAIVESMPVFQFTPGVVAMPMMMASAGISRGMSLDQFRSPSEQNCSASKDRIDALELQVEALDLRMQTIQRSVEIQTKILEEMKAEKIFPKRYLKSDEAEAP